MIRRSFRMKLKEGKIEEYKKRHDEIWPELSSTLASLGISNYSIYYDSKDNTLIEYMELTDENRFDELEEMDIVKKWNIYMQDLLITKSFTDASAVVDELIEVFYHK
jgi:L-rhamnose mutarotase